MRFETLRLEELGCFPVKLHLEIDKNVTPVQHGPRKIPAALKDDINSKLDQIIKQGILKVNEPTNWKSSFMAVKKPGNKGLKQSLKT